MANRLETEGVFVHALAMVPTPYQAVLVKSFERLSVSTGGTMHQASTGDAAMAIVQRIAAQCLDDLDFDARLYELMKSGLTETDALADALKVKNEHVWSGQMRLRQRRLWR